MMICATTKKCGCPHEILCFMECNAATYEQVKILSPKHLRYRGLGLVWTALVIFTLFLLIALSLDTAKLAFNIHELQNAADAAALAGAQIVNVVPANVTRQWTHDMGLANRADKLDVTLRMTAQDDPFVEDPNLDIILGRWINHQRYFFPTLDAPDAVRVIARRADGLTDAPALARLLAPPGVDDAKATRVAIGWYAEVSGAGLIVLDPCDTEQGLFVAGTGDIKVIGGSIHVNSRATGTKDNPHNPAAVYAYGDARMLCGRLTLQGKTDPPSNNPSLWESIWTQDMGTYDMEVPYDIYEGAPYMPDPLEYLVPPTIPSDANGYIVNSYDEKTDGSCTLYPGYYPDGIEVSATGTFVKLESGTYILGGGHLNKDSGLIQTGGTLEGDGVLIYLTKDFTDPNNGRWAQLDIGGNVVTTITPPGDWMDPKVINGLPGISIWQDRENTENQAELSGLGAMNISGTLYFPKNHLYLAGEPGKTGNQILCWTVEVHGTAEILVIYDGRNNNHKGTSVLVQ